MPPIQQANIIPQVIDFVGSEIDTKLVPYQRMANTIIYLTLKHGECLPKDLPPFAFSEEETKNMWHMAQAMAAVELRLMKKDHYSSEAHHD